MLKIYYPALFFIVYVVGWRWYIFHHIYPDRWYESFGHAAFIIGLAFVYLSMWVHTVYLKEHMVSKKCITFMFFIEVVFLSIVFFTLYVFGVEKSAIEENSYIFLILAVIIFFLARKSLYTMFLPIFNGEYNGRDTIKDLGLIRNGIFDDLKACIITTLLLIVFILMILFLD